MCPSPVCLRMLQILNMHLHTSLSQILHEFPLPYSLHICLHTHIHPHLVGNILLENPKSVYSRFSKEFCLTMIIVLGFTDKPCLKTNRSRISKLPFTYTKYMINFKFKFMLTNIQNLPILDKNKTAKHAYHFFKLKAKMLTDYLQILCVEYWLLQTGGKEMMMLRLGRWL